MIDTIKRGFDGRPFYQTLNRPLRMDRNVLKKYTVLPTLTMLMSLLVSPCGYAATASDTVDAFHAALHVGDKEAALAILAPDVTIFESGYVERSRAEYAAHHLADDMAFAKAVKRRVLRKNEKVANDQTVLWEESETTGQFKGKNVHSFGTETTTLVKAGERWTIVHIHWSSRKAP